MLLYHCNDSLDHFILEFNWIDSFIHWFIYELTDWVTEWPTQSKYLLFLLLFPFLHLDSFTSPCYSIPHVIPSPMWNLLLAVDDVATEQQLAVRLVDLPGKSFTCLIVCKVFLIIEFHITYWVCNKLYEWMTDWLSDWIHCIALQYNVM